MRVLRSRGAISEAPGQRSTGVKYSRFNNKPSDRRNSSYECMDERMNLTKASGSRHPRFLYAPGLRTVIPRSIRLAEGNQFLASRFSHTMSAPVEQRVYIQLAKEILAREQTAGQTTQVLGKGLPHSFRLPAPSYPKLSKQPHRSWGVFTYTSALRNRSPTPCSPVYCLRSVQNAGSLRNPISVNGLIQPLILRRKSDRSELIAVNGGLRAAHLAGLDRSSSCNPGLRRTTVSSKSPHREHQREDLNPIETAQALDSLAAGDAPQS